MSSPAQRDLLSYVDVVRATTVARAANDLRYGSFGENEVTGGTVQRIVEAVPAAVAAHLTKNVFVFVPLALGETAQPRDTEIARAWAADLAERAICHRTVPFEDETFTFISARLMQDRFALAFEFFINVAHQFADQLVATAAVPERFAALLASQVLADVRGETSQDAWEWRKRAVEQENQAEAQKRYAEAAFSDAIAIYLLSLAIDLDYADLREREYPLLAAPALADRLRLAAELYPPQPGYEFAVRYRRRH